MESCIRPDVDLLRVLGINHMVQGRVVAAIDVYMLDSQRLLRGTGCAASIISTRGCRRLDCWSRCRLLLFRLLFARAQDHLEHARVLLQFLLLQ